MGPLRVAGRKLMGLMNLVDLVDLMDLMNLTEGHHQQVPDVQNIRDASKQLYGSAQSC